MGRADPTSGPKPAGREPIPAVARCGESGCNAHALELCAYVDSHGHACRTHWCGQHGALIGGLRYCRRHAGTMGALGSKANNPRALPDVDYRGASLVRWLFRDLDPTLTDLLEKRSDASDHLLRDSEVSVARDESGARRWEMGWKLASPAGISVRVTLVAEEADDSIVFVRVGDEVVARGTPPWIEARRRGEHLSDEEDHERRRQFYEFIGDYLDSALQEIA